MMCCAAFNSVILPSFMLAGCKQIVSATGAADYQKRHFLPGFCVEITVCSKLATSQNMLINIDRKNKWK